VTTRRSPAYSLTVLLLTLAGCFHHSPDEAVLAPIVAQFTQEPFDQSNQPEYLIFADELTAKVFKHLRQDPHYRIVPAEKTFICPPDATPCPHPHVLAAHIVWLAGDSAIAVIRRDYSRGPAPERPVRATEQILLVRRNGRWKIEKVLGYTLSPLG
jgi:hypothetical protein